jgi:hypothetical protein
MENNKENELLSKGYFKSIPLYPTEFHVDVWICDDLDNLSVYFNKRYGASAEYYKEELSRNQVFTVVATSESELKGIKTIVANMDSWDAGTIVHELNHVIFHLSNICHLEIGYNSQEWVSYMIEYLFNRCKNDGSFLVMP